MVQSPGLAPILLSPQTSHDHLLLVSTAEILFNDSVFALLPGQEMFVKSKVPISGLVGLGGGGDAGGSGRLEGRSHLDLGERSRWEEK